MDIIEAIFITAIGTLVGFFIGMSDGKCKKKSINNVHFYVARNKYNKVLYLYLGKPIKGIDRFHACYDGCVITSDNHFSSFGLNYKDFENLTFDDKPVEVFLNLEN